MKSSTKKRRRTIEIDVDLGKKFEDLNSEDAKELGDIAKKAVEKYERRGRVWLKVKRIFAWMFLVNIAALIGCFIMPEEYDNGMIFLSMNLGGILAIPNSYLKWKK